MFRSFNKISVDSLDCLRAHNGKRRLHYNTPSLTWDAGLAKGSQDWSLKLANENSNPVKLLHSSGSYGENVAYSGTSGSANKGCRDAVNSW